LRLALSTVACMVLPALREFGPPETDLARAQADTIRLKLLPPGSQTLRKPVRRRAACEMRLRSCGSSG
jgi:hypothetical protein